MKRSAIVFSGVFFLMMMLSGLTISELSAQRVTLNDNENRLDVRENTYYKLDLYNTLGEFNTLQVKTGKGIFTRILIPGYTKGGSIGNPELPVRRELIEIPVGAGVRINILNTVSKEYNLSGLDILYPVFPLQPEIPKTGEHVPFEYNETAYKTNAFHAGNLVRVELLGISREVQLGRLDISPIQYNPVTETLKIFSEIEFEILFEDPDLAKTMELKRIYGNHYFSAIHRSLLNYKSYQAANRDTLVTYPVKYVIVSDRMFESQLQPLIAWKIKKGFTVVEAYTDDPAVGNTTFQIKAYLEDLYNNATVEDPPPSFILFVGDIAQIPTWNGNAGGHVTDLFYCEYTSDYFPEVFYGRFSAQDTAQLQPQIDKTLMYEQYTMPDPSYLNEVVMVAGMDGTYAITHGNGQINYGTENYFNTTFGILSHTYLYPESGSNAANIRQDISNGVTFGNYTAHCNPTGWGNPSFNTGHIPQLQNQDKYGLLVGNCCSSSEFQQNECFAEALLRAEGKGAVGYIGASNSTFWDPDYYWGVGVGQISGTPPPYEETTLGAYDRAFHSHGEPFESWCTTQMQMIYAGNLAVTEGDPSSAEYYWEAYCLMGDPSLMIYFSEPPALTATYDPLLPLGSSSLTVTTEPYAYVALSMDGICYGTGLAGADGVAQLSLQPISQPGTADIVATCQNFQPFTGTILVANPEGPYIMLNDFMINDDAGNNNGLADYGEDILLDVELKNWGNSDAPNVRATLSAEDEFIIISDDYQEWGTILAQDSSLQTDAYLFTVDDSIPDQHIVYFTLDIEDDTRETWSSDFTVILNAPLLLAGSLAIDDSQSGNNNGRMDPGENVDIIIGVINNGHSDAFNVVANLYTGSTDITIHNSTVEYDTLEMLTADQAIFNVTVGEDVEIGTVIELNFTLTSGPYYVEKDFAPVVGLIVEDFETGDFTAFNWLFGGELPWQIVDNEAYEGNCAARSGAITDEQTSEIYIDLTVLADDSISFFKKVSCEPDPPNMNYDYLAFFIDGVEQERWDGELGWSRNAYPVTAGDHTFTWLYSKDYSVSNGEDCAWIDYIVFPAIADPVSVAEQNKLTGLALRVYPNPAKNKINFVARLPETCIVSLTILDLMGRQVKQVVNMQEWQAGMHEIQLEIPELNNGIYYCIFTAGDQKMAEKLIISK